MSDDAAVPEQQEIGAWPKAIGSALLAAAGFIGFILIFIETGNFSPEAQPFPRLIAIIGMIGAGIALAQSCRSALAVQREQRMLSRSGAAPSWRDLLVSYAGPPIYGAMLAVLGERRPLVMTAIAGGTLGAIYLVFEVGFSIHLPGSMLLPLLLGS